MNELSPSWLLVKGVIAVAASGLYVVLFLVVFGLDGGALMIAALLPPVAFLVGIRSPLVILVVGLVLLGIDAGSWLAYLNNRKGEQAAAVIGLYPFYGTILVLIGSAIDQWYRQR